eukprot:g1990.t1
MCLTHLELLSDVALWIIGARLLLALTTADAPIEETALSFIFHSTFMGLVQVATTLPASGGLEECLSYNKLDENGQLIWPNYGVSFITQSFAGGRACADMHLQCFQELAEMIEKDVIFDDLLFMHAKEMSTSGAMQEVLLVEEDNANDIVRVVDPAAANIWSVGNLCDTAAFRSELGKIISGDADILPRSERTTPTFGDSLKSQEGESGGENEIFATEFRETILNRQSFDSVVYIYDPSCAVCKSMAPVWKQVVKNHKHVQTLELFAMNGRENDVKGVVVNSYPTLLLFSAFGKSEYREYKGSRTAGHISAWIHENTGNRFTKAPDSEAQKTEL